MLFQVSKDCSKNQTSIPSRELGSMNYHSKEYLHIKSYFYLRNKNFAPIKTLQVPKIK